MFECTEPAVDTARIIGGEIVPTGPMFGIEMRACPAGPAAEREAAILTAHGLALADFARVRAIAEGTRRDAAIAVTDPVVRAVEPAGTLEVEFALPAGAYATVVMREIMKPDETPSGSIDDAAEPT
jgi:tRNA pseudouridine13 synthase